MNAVVAYFERKAIPDNEYAVVPLGASDLGPLRFETSPLQLDPTGKLPAVAGLTWVPSKLGGGGFLAVCDMRSGGLYKVNFRSGRKSPLIKPLVNPGSIYLSNPCHVQPCDLDGDGKQDLVVADLGTFHPKDELEGRVVWLRATSEDGYRPELIASSLGRVADVQAGDFDGDGLQDLIVGEFGWHQTGCIRLMKNLGEREGMIKFERTTLDPRHGTIHVPVVDLNRDGKLDFIALISQEHEVVDAFLNLGGGQFEQSRIFSAPTPSWGSSGIQLVDLDKDGDLDVLHTNGDSFDRSFLRPLHAIHWLENRGTYPWVQHELLKMPGCHRALPGDMDGDGDLDIVAVSMLHDQIRDRFGMDNFAAVCCLEQTSPGKFTRRTLELGTCDHPCLEIGDFDDDGDLDLAVGNFHFVQPADEQPPSLTIWWNDAHPGHK